jgi:hypothetical protein
MREKKQKRAIGARSCDSAVYRDTRTSARANEQHTIMRSPASPKVSQAETAAKRRLL